VSVLRAGSFEDRGAAEEFVQRAVDRQPDRIAHWLASEQSARLVIEAYFDGETTGRVVPWGLALHGAGALKASGVRVVLRRDAAQRNGFLVLTAYPTEE
jgi:hypothetical protein